MRGGAVLLTIASFVIFAAFAIAALSYIRALNALFTFLRERGYTDWGFRHTLGIDQRFISDRLVVGAELGIGIRDISDEHYRLLLSAVRKRLLICAALFIIFVIGLGWSTQGTMAPP